MIFNLVQVQKEITLEGASKVESRQMGHVSIKLAPTSVAKHQTRAPKRLLRIQHVVRQLKIANMKTTPTLNSIS